MALPNKHAFSCLRVTEEDTPAIIMKQAVAFDATKPFTLAVCCMLDTVKGTLFEFEGAFSLAICGQALKFSLQGKKALVFDAESFLFTANAWHRIAIVVDREHASVYANGLCLGTPRLVNDPAATAIDSASQISLGKGCRGYFHALQLYSSALTKTQLRRNSLIPVEATDTLVLNFLFATRTTHDLTDARNTLTLAGKTRFTDIARALCCTERGCVLPVGPQATFNPTALPGRVYTIHSKVIPSSRRSAHATLCSHGAPGSPQSFDFAVVYSSDGLGYLQVEDGGVLLRSPVALPLDHWINVAASFDGSKLRLYHDGAQVAETTATPSRSADTIQNAYTPFVIGNAFLATKGPARQAFGGAIDHVACFAEALEPSRLAELSLNPPGLFTPHTELLCTFFGNEALEATTSTPLAFSAGADLCWLAGTNGSKIGMAECDNPPIERTLPAKTQWQIQAFTETCTAVLENYYGLTLPKNLFASPDASHISAATAYVADHALNNPDTQALMFLVDRGLSHIEQTNNAETPTSSLAVEVGTIIAAGASCSALTGVITFARTLFNTTAGYQVLGRTTLADLGGGFGVGIMGGPEATADEAAVSMTGEAAPYLGIALGGSLLGDVLSRCSKRNTSSSSSGGGGSNPSQEKNPHDPPSKEPEPPVSGPLH